MPNFYKDAAALLTISIVKEEILPYLNSERIKRESI
jgi:hypothetical protein